jgi:hypothetical protein
MGSDDTRQQRLVDVASSEKDFSNTAMMKNIDVTQQFG